MDSGPLGAEHPRNLAGEQLAQHLPALGRGRRQHQVAPGRLTGPAGWQQSREQLPGGRPGAGLVQQLEAETGRGQPRRPVGDRLAQQLDAGVGVQGEHAPSGQPLDPAGRKPVAGPGAPVDAESWQPDRGSVPSQRVQEGAGRGVRALPG